MHVILKHNIQCTPRGRMRTWHTLLEWRRAHSRRLENGEWRTSSLSQVKNEKWRKLLVEGFTIFHMGLLLSPGIHTTKSAWWMRKRTSNPSVWIEHKFLPHAGGNGNSHSPFSILHSPRASKGCHTFLHGEAILLAPLFPHSPFSIVRGGVTTPSIVLFFSFFSMTHLRNTEKVVLSRCRLRKNMKNGVKKLYYWGVVFALIWQMA
jgi:hypothetical protein